MLKKQLLATSILLAASTHHSAIYEGSWLNCQSVPQPKYKRGKFKRRNKGNKQ